MNQPKKFTRTKLKYELYDGSVIELPKPLYSELKVLEATIKSIPADEKKAEESERVVRAFLISAGMTAEQLNGMELEHIFEIVDDMTGKKKA